MVRQPIQYFAAAERNLLQTARQLGPVRLPKCSHLCGRLWSQGRVDHVTCLQSLPAAYGDERWSMVDGCSRSESLAIGPDHGKWKPMFVSVRGTNHALTPLNASILGNDETARRRLPVTEGECAFCVKVDNAGYCRVTDSSMAVHFLLLLRADDPDRSFTRRLPVRKGTNFLRVIR